MRDNEVLKAYYERLGFEPRGEAVFEDFSAMRFERRCRR
jgi:RimJ/RimL family protein N-acetyltransferase